MVCYRSSHKFSTCSAADSWTVYRFLTQHHPEPEGDTALSALQRGKVDKVLAAAENTAGAFSQSVARRFPPEGFESSGIELASIKTGTKWFRLYSSRYPDPPRFG